MRFRHFAPLFLGGCCLLLFFAWLPGVKYPVVSDTVNYALLGRSLWEHGTYSLNGIPYSNHLPLHALLSYPLTELFGFHLGMHVSSLLGAFGVLLAMFLLVRRVASPLMAAGVVAAVLLHPSFILMSMLGSADLLFTMLFLLSIFSFLKAEDDQRWYIGAGMMAGFASLTRYNGLPLFVLFILWVALKRRRHLTNRWAGLGLGLGLGLASLWFIRNGLVFGNPLYSSYTAELAQEAPNPLVMFIKNIFYYGNPLHNVFPFFFIFALIGLWRHARRYPFLVLAMITAWSLSMIWWVQAIRFMFPGFTILLFFSVLGIGDVLSRVASGKRLVVSAALIACGIAIQSASLCLYTYGECNAWFDRTVGVLPKNLGLTPEGFYAWHLARQELNARAEQGAVVWYELPQEAAGIFRDDLKVTNDPHKCPAYRITQRPEVEEEVIFQTEEAPVTSLVHEACGQRRLSNAS